MIIRANNPKGKKGKEREDLKNVSVFGNCFILHDTKDANCGSIARGPDINQYFCIKLHATKVSR